MVRCHAAVNLGEFGDARAVERNIVLLIEAGFTPAGRAIRIYTLNAAQFLGQADRIGTIAAGKAADLVVINGDPSKTITDIEKMIVVCSAMVLGTTCRS